MVKQASQPELSTLEGHQLQGMTFFIQRLPPTFPEPTKGQEYILTTTRFTLVYNSEHKNNSFVFHPPGK